MSSDRQGQWISVISGERRGPAAAIQRAGLSLLAGLYRAALAAANLRFVLPACVRRAPCPVVSVGNVTVGGTGKTPMVAWLARAMVEMGKRPIIVSRGYGGGGGPNEEAIELERLCPGIPHTQNPDRWQAICNWTASHLCDAAILDDGFQHRRLARDLDIVLVDAIRPFGYGRLVPRGLLREPLSALGRAHVVVITRAELVTAAEVAQLKAALASHLQPGTPVLVAEHHPTGLAMIDGSRLDVKAIAGQEVAAACAIGHPEAFRLTLERLGVHVKVFRTFRDHHAYTLADLEGLFDAARAAAVKTLLTTGKDLVKWRPLVGGRRLPVDVAALEVSLRFAEGEEVIRRRIAGLWG